MKTAVKSPESADYRRGLGIFLTETPPTDTPKHLFRPPFPRNPHFPALRSGLGRRSAAKTPPPALSGASRRKQSPSSHLLGLDHERLTFRYQGRNFRLTDVHGHVVKALLRT
jgi:hypothetical protein